MTTDIITNYSCSTPGHETRAAVVAGLCAECANDELIQLRERDTETSQEINQLNEIALAALAYVNWRTDMTWKMLIKSIEALEGKGGE